MARSYAFALALLTILATPPGRAAQITASLEHTSDYTTNTARTEDDKVKEWIHRPAVNLDVSHQGPSVELDADYNFQRRFYQKDLFDDENALTGNAELTWHARPERLDLWARNTRSESTQRAFEPETQDNRQEISYTEAGPTLMFQPRSGDDLEFEYVYTDINAEETDTDSERNSGVVRYILGLSSARTLTFESDFTDIDFEAESSPDIDAWNHTVTYSQSGGRLDFSLMGGYSRFDRSLDRDTVDGPIFDLQLTWERGPSIFTLNANHQIVDRDTALDAGTVGFGEILEEDSDLNEVYEQTRGDVAWRRTAGRNVVTLTIFASKEDYEDVARDSDQVGASVQWTRELTRRTTLEAQLQAVNRDFEEETEDQDRYRGTLSLNREAGRALELTLGVSYDKQKGGRPYEEWIIGAGFTYTFLGAQTEQ